MNLSCRDTNRFLGVIKVQVRDVELFANIQTTWLFEAIIEIRDALALLGFYLHFFTQNLYYFST